MRIVDVPVIEAVGPDDGFVFVLHRLAAVAGIADNRPSRIRLSHCLDRGREDLPLSTKQFRIISIY